MGKKDDIQFSKVRWNTVRFLTVSRKLMIFFSLLLAVVSLSLFVYLPSRFEEQALHDMKSKTSSITEIISYSVGPAYMFGDSINLQETIESIRQDSEVVFVVFIGANDSVLTTYNPFNVEQHQYRSLTGKDRISDDGKLLLTYTEVRFQSSPIGKLYMGFSLSRLHKEIVNTRSSIALMSFLLFIIGTLSIMWVSIIITRPLDRMVTIVKSITEGDLSKRAVVESKDEFGLLAESFNGMVDRLHLLNKDLELSNQELEARVQNRTIDLQREIFERKQSEEALRNSEKLLRSFAENFQGILFIIDRSGHFTFSEGRGLTALGLKPGQVVGLSAYDLYKDNPIIGNNIKSALNGISESSVVNIDFTIFEVNFHPIRTNEGEISGVLGVALNITERVQVEETLRHAQKLESIGTLAGGIAHDFNNLLNSIIGQSSLALKKISNEHPASQNITKAIKASERAAILTRQLLAYSGKGKFFTAEVDLNQMIEENVQMLEVSVPKTIHLKFDLEHPSPHVVVDVGQLQQVIMNLIINAGEAIGSNPGSITVRTNHIEINGDEMAFSKYTNTVMKPGTYALLQVIDTGCGISEELLLKIFDPFYTTKFTGRGLGLAAVLGIIRGHNGGLRIESKEGKGTKFEIILPLVEPTSQPFDSPKITSEEVKGEGKTILVIDDDPFIIDLLTDILSGAHFKMLGVIEPAEGIELYRREQQNISMVILDFSMPGMDGKTVFEKLVEINPKIKVLLSSGYTEEDTLLSFGNLRPTGFFQKPYKPDELLQRLSTILSDL